MASNPTLQFHKGHFFPHLTPPNSPSLALFPRRIHYKVPSLLNLQSFIPSSSNGRRRGTRVFVAAAAGGNAAWLDAWKPDDKSPSVPLSDIFWPAAGAFAAMAILGKVDQMIASRGVSITIAPLGAVSAVLFTAPSSPAARKYNMFMAQIGCAAIGVLAFSLLGPGWLARSSALAASIAFMIYTRSTHPPAASLPLLFIDGAKLHGLSYWYALFPGAAGCLILCLLQEIVSYLKEKVRF